MFPELKFYLGRNLFLTCLIVMLTTHLAFSLDKSDNYLEQATRFLDKGYDLQAILSYRKAISFGLDSPSIRRDMAFAYYNLGMLDEAIKHMEIGTSISFQDPNILIELGILYGAKGNLSKSISVLKDALRLDPSQGDVYIYLGLALLRQGHVELAWQSARIAEKLHQNPLLLVEKLLESGKREPEHYPFQDPGSTIALRQIVLDDEKQGEELIARWQQGSSLADSFQGSTKVAGQPLGGYIGAFTKNELKPEIFAVVSHSNNYDPPTIIQTSDGYLLVQRIWPFDPKYWMDDENVKLTEASENPLPTVIAKEKPTDSASQNGSADDIDHAAFKLLKVDAEKIPLFTGSFQQKKYAIEQLLQLRKMGFSAYYLKRQNDTGRPRYNVIAGEFVSVKDVLKAKAVLNEKGYDSFYPKK